MQINKDNGIENKDRTVIGRMGIVHVKKGIYFKRPCDVCGEQFRPTGRGCRKCDSCCAKSRQETIMRMKQNEQKK